jgi:hypothetical protein
VVLLRCAAGRILTSGNLVRSCARADRVPSNARGSFRTIAKAKELLMKTALKSLLIIVGAVGLCSCESMPDTDSDTFVGGQFISSRDQALYEQYQEGRSEVGYGEAFIDELNAWYSTY